MHAVAARNYIRTAARLGIYLWLFATVTEAAFDSSHNDFDILLHRYVRKGHVFYRELKRNREILDSYLARLESVEYEMIIEAVKTTRGNLSRAARMLGLTNRQMGIRAYKYGIDFKAYRAA